MSNSTSASSAMNRPPRREGSAPPSSASATSHSIWNEPGEEERRPVVAAKAGQHAAQRLHRPVGERDDRLAERIAKRRAQPLHDEAQQQRVDEEAEHVLSRNRSACSAWRSVSARSRRACRPARPRAPAAAFTAATIVALTASRPRARRSRARSCRPSTSPARAGAPARNRSARPARSRRRTSRSARRRASRRRETELARGLLERFEKIEHVRRAAAGDRGHRVELVLALAPQIVAPTASSTAAARVRPSPSTPDSA